MEKASRNILHKDLQASLCSNKPDSQPTAGAWSHIFQTASRLAASSRAVLHVAGASPREVVGVHSEEPTKAPGFS